MIVELVELTDKFSEAKGVLSMTAVGLNLGDDCNVGEAKRDATTSVGSGLVMVVKICPETKIVGVDALTLSRTGSFTSGDGVGVHVGFISDGVGELVTSVSSEKSSFPLIAFAPKGKHVNRKQNAVSVATIFFIILIYPLLPICP
jgi:hypothetical protein